MDKTIVAAIAGPGESRQTLALAARAAQTAHLPLVIAGVAIATDFVPAVPMAGWAAAPADTNRLHDEVLRDLRGLTDGLPQDLDVHVDAVVALSVAEGIETLALRHDAAAVVVGATRHAVVTRAFAGDHALSIVNHAPCPVLIAAAGEPASGRAADAPIRVGAAWDRSPEADEALHAAARFAASIDAVLHVVHVLELEVPAVLPPADPQFGAELVATRRKEAEASIRQSLGDTAPALEIDIRAGSRYAELTAASKLLDVLFVGSRRKGPLRRVAFGSVSGHLAHHSSCPVAVVPRGATVAVAV